MSGFDVEAVEVVLWGAGAAIQLLSARVQHLRFETAHLPEWFGLFVILALGSLSVGIGLGSRLVAGSEIPRAGSRKIRRSRFRASKRLHSVVLALELPEAGEAHIEQVAVRHDHRHRGIARLLLRHAFRGFYRRGQSSCTLWTHSDTGVLSLYQRVGMTVRRRSTVYSRPLRG